MYSKNNFHKHTFCIFKEVAATEIEDLKLNYSSKSGSEYSFTDEGVYRKSNHWGRAANCKWRLQTQFSDSSRTKIGFAKWSDFHPINDTGKWYYIEVDFQNKTVQYNHKSNSDVQNLFLRNAIETTKRVKEIRALLSNDKKLHYWNYSESIEKLLEKVIDYMVNSDKNLLEIKHQILK